MNTAKTTTRQHLQRARAVLALAAVSLAPAACAPETTPSVADTAGVPSAHGTAPADPDLGGVRLTEMGFRNGPADFRVPDGLVLTGRVDQANVVTLLMDGAQGQRVHDYLMATLTGTGWTIEGASDDSIVFSDGDWQGAFTMADEQAGLTLRRQPVTGTPG